MPEMGNPSHAALVSPLLFVKVTVFPGGAGDGGAATTTADDEMDTFAFPQDCFFGTSE